jgi:hypothetical protein
VNANPERIVVPRPRPVDLVLLLAGLLTTGMALYHFWLPSVFRWGDALGDLPAPALRWALFMLNASFSYLLLTGGVLSLEIARRSGARDPISRLVLVAVGGYWVFNFVYQLVSPLPLPRPLVGLRWGFLGFSLSAVCLYGAALVRPAEPEAAPTLALEPRR